jgi:hypothetical protein
VGRAQYLPRRLSIWVHEDPTLYVLSIHLTMIGSAVTESGAQAAAAASRQATSASPAGDGAGFEFLFAGCGPERPDLLRLALLVCDRGSGED